MFDKSLAMVTERTFIESGSWLEAAAAAAAAAATVSSSS
jgi:hypothetical protein